MSDNAPEHSPTPQDDADPCGIFDHTWGDHYYGYECTKCGMFVPFGSEPWMPIDDHEEDDPDYLGSVTWRGWKVDLYQGEETEDD